MSDQQPLTYASSGVNYASLDLLKRLAQQKAKATAGQLENANMSEVGASRGESAYVWQDGDRYFAFVVEGLGTKNLVADATRPMTDRTYYDAIAQDTVAMIINDLIVVGAKPLVINAYFAAGNTNWFDDEQRTTDLVEGWAAACELAGATWGGGETPALKGILAPDKIDLAGSAIGVIESKERLVLGDKLTEGDAIVLIESNGIHANGLTLARSIADRLPEGFGTSLSDGSLYGEALLKPTHIYAQLVQAVLDKGIDVHYMVNITGHGWRKLMRAEKEFSYVLDTVPPVEPLFEFIQEQADVDDQEMYGNFNMGAGFAFFVPAKDAQIIVDEAAARDLKAWIAGKVEAGSKQVVIKPKNITFEGKSLGVR